MAMIYALRLLRKSPGFAAVAILTLAFGIGATTAIFSVVDRVVLRPLDYANSSRLVSLWETKRGIEIREISLSWENYLDWRVRNRVFTHLAARNSARHTLTGVGDAEFVEGSNITANLFAVLGVEPRLGRTFSAEEEQTGGPPAIILTWAFFERLFRADPGALGKTVTLDGTAYTVVGVTPAGFRYPVTHLQGQFFLPLGRLRPEGRASHPGISGLGLLKPGVTIAAAQSDMDRVATELAAEYPASNSSSGAGVAFLRDRVVEDVRGALLVLLGAVALVLLIACANIANLLLARAAGRRQEMAVRAALGASRTDLVKQLLTESLALASLGGAAGIAVAYGGLKTLVALLPADTPRLAGVSLDTRTLAFALAVSLATGLVFGLVPAWQVSRRGLGDAVRGGSRLAGDRAGERGRRFLVAAEVALALVLLTGAGLLLESFRRLVDASPGFLPGRVVSMDLGLSPQKYPSPERQAVFFRRLLENVQALRGVEAVAVSAGALGGWQQELEISGKPKDLNKPIATDFALVSPGYFRALGIPIKRGRPFAASDGAGAPRVCVVDETLASTFFPGMDPVGRRISAGGSECEIAGVAGHVKNYGVDQPSRFETYVPFDQVPRLNGTLMVKSSGELTPLIAAIRAELRNLDPELPIRRVTQLEASVAAGRASKRAASSMLAAFALLALGLAAIGLYGVVSYSVAERTREIGIRMALGAGRRGVLGMVLGQGTRTALAGVAAGFAGAALLARFISSLLFGVSPLDWRVFLLAASVMIAVASGAAFIPAWRASRVDPMVALRDE